MRILTNGQAPCASLLKVPFGCTPLISVGMVQLNIEGPSMLDDFGPSALLSCATIPKLIQGDDQWYLGSCARCKDAKRPIVAPTQSSSPNHRTCDSLRAPGSGFVRTVGQSKIFLNL